MSFYAGNTNAKNSKTSGYRYFYGLRRNNIGELYLAKNDRLDANDGIALNAPGDPADNFRDFHVGEDFHEGRDVYHNLIFPNLNYEQFRWDKKNIFYYVNDEGELVARVNHGYTYPTGV